MLLYQSAWWAVVFDLATNCNLWDSIESDLEIIPDDRIWWTDPAIAASTNMKIIWLIKHWQTQKSTSVKVTYIYLSLICRYSPRT